MVGLGGKYYFDIKSSDIFGGPIEHQYLLLPKLKLLQRDTLAGDVLKCLAFDHILEG